MNKYLYSVICKNTGTLYDMAETRQEAREIKRHVDSIGKETPISKIVQYKLPEVVR